MGKVINHIENMVFIVNCNNIVQLVNELRETYNDNERTMTEYYYKDSHDFLVLLSNVQRPNLATANGHPLLGVIVELFITDSIEDGNRNVVNSSILFKVIKDLLRDR